VGAGGVRAWPAASTDWLRKVGTGGSGSRVGGDADVEPTRAGSLAFAEIAVAGAGLLLRLCLPTDTVLGRRGDRVEPFGPVGQR